MKTLSVKVRQDSWAWLDAAAREVNFVWNYVNELCAKAARPYHGKPRWLSGYDVDKLLAGTSRELEYLPQLTIARIAMEHADKRKQAKCPRLSWRRSGGSRKSLGWVPFRRGQMKFKRGAIVFAGRRFRVFDSYGLDKYDLRVGSFAQNALGEWFLNIVVNVETKATDLPAKAIGIDLGLKDIAVTSDGDKLPAGRWYRGIEQKVAQAQRRGHKRQAKRFQRDAANRRKDALHKFSTKLVKGCGAIYIGDVSSTKLAKTRMAKSVLDAGWGMLKTMLQQKGHQAGRVVEVVDERFTTQACSACGSITGPKGRAQLVVREWTCGDCGTSHSRDINAARNILALGLQGPSAGTVMGSQSSPVPRAPSPALEG
jgi:putative transposase